MLQSERYENDADNNAERFMVYVMIVISRVERRRKWKIDLQHMKHSSVQIKERAEQTQEQREHSPVEYAQGRIADNAERVSRGAAAQVKNQSGKAVKHVKEKQRLKREEKQIRKELREGRIPEQGERPSFSPSGGEKGYQPKEQMINYVKDIYAPFADEEISAKMVELLTPKGTKAKVEIVYQPLEGLHEACPHHKGDWYFSGNYPTPGGVKMVNRAFIDYIEQMYQF